MQYLISRICTNLGLNYFLFIIYAPALTQWEKSITSLQSDNYRETLHVQPCAISPCQQNKLCGAQQDLVQILTSCCLFHSSVSRKKRNPHTAECKVFIKNTVHF